jgi:hypothetical protein
MAEKNKTHRVGDAAGRNNDQLGGKICSINSQNSSLGQVQLPLRTDRHRDPVDWQRERRILSAVEFLTVADREEPIPAWRQAKRHFGLDLAAVLQAERRASALRNGGW